jgi:hypothetical protein
MKLQYDLDARTVTDESGYVMPIVRLFMNEVEYGPNERPDIVGPVKCIIACGPTRSGEWLCVEKELIGVPMSVN